MLHALWNALCFVCVCVCACIGNDAGSYASCNFFFNLFQICQQYVHSIITLLWRFYSSAVFLMVTELYSLHISIVCQILANKSDVFQGFTPTLLQRLPRNIFPKCNYQQIWKPYAVDQWQNWQCSYSVAKHTSENYSISMSFMCTVKVRRRLFSRCFWAHWWLQWTQNFVSVCYLIVDMKQHALYSVVKL